MMTSSNKNDLCKDTWSDSGDGYYSDDVFDETSPSGSSIAQLSFTPSLTLAGDSVQLYALSEHIAPVWRIVGRHLQLRECIIENIDIDHEGEDEREKAYQLLLEWSRRFGSEATLHDLLNVLVYIGKDDIANAISLSNRDSHPMQQRASIGSERAMKLVIKSHMKLQKQGLRVLNNALQFYQQRLKEVEHLQSRYFETKEEQERKEKLQELDKVIVQGKLDFLQVQLSNMQDVKYSELDGRLRDAADRLYEIDKIFNHFNDAFEELRVLYYSQIECTFGGLCYFRHMKYSPRGSSSGTKQRHSSRRDEEPEDEVFRESSSEGSRSASHSGLARNTWSRSSLSKLFRHSTRRSKTYPQSSRRTQEQHTKRRYGVTAIDMDEQFQLQDFITKFCRRYRQHRPFVYDHCCMNTLSRDAQQTRAQAFPSVDPSTLPIPSYHSSEAITSLVTSPTGIHASTGFVNVICDWV